MIYTVTFNPSLDYVVTVDHFTNGIVNRTTEEIMLPGGKGINVSLVLKNLGYDSTAFGFVSGFTGEELKKILENSLIKTDFIPVKEGMTRINVKLRSDKETEINGQGPFIRQEDIDTLYKKLDVLKENDVLVLAGSIPSMMPQSIYRDIMKYLQDKKLKVVVDATKELLLNVLEYHPFLIKPNNHELGEMFHTTITSKEDVVIYAKKLREMGAQNVLVSMAGDGAVLVTEDNQVFKANVPKGKVRNSVGAGDSMVAGFLAGYFANGEYMQAFQMGVCTGSASAFSEALATKQEVLDLLKQSGELFQKEG